MTKRLKGEAMPRTCHDLLPGDTFWQYDKPTYRVYSDPADQWQEWKRQANALGEAEMARHASVSTSNRHACRECFCCACVEVLAERREAMTQPPKACPNCQGEREWITPTRAVCYFCGLEVSV